jgi:hypothetical protein
MINILVSIIAFFGGVFMSIGLLLDSVSNTLGKHINDDIHHNSKKENNKD